MTDYTSTARLGCDAAPCGQCDFTRAQVEMMRKMELVEKLGKRKGGVINAFFKPGEGWLITYKLR